MTDKVQKINEEIERRIAEGYSKNYISEGALALKSLLDFIDSIQEESGCEVNFTTKNKDLEEAADKYAQQHGELLGFDCDCEPIQTGPDIKKAVKFGAEWQKQQMMKNAVDATILDVDAQTIEFGLLPEKLLDIKEGDKVKIIIVKED